jgi:hypothetical protein
MNSRPPIMSINASPLLMLPSSDRKSLTAIGLKAALSWAIVVMSRASR